MSVKCQKLEAHYHLDLSFEFSSFLKLFVEKRNVMFYSLFKSKKLFYICCTVRTKKVQKCDRSRVRKFVGQKWRKWGMPVLLPRMMMIEVTCCGAMILLIFKCNPFEIWESLVDWWCETISHSVMNLSLKILWAFYAEDWPCEFI